MMDTDAWTPFRPAPRRPLSLLTGEVCTEAGVDPTEVYEVVLCGNQTMTQLVLGIDPEPLAVAPFIIAARNLPPATAADFGIEMHPRAPAMAFPALGAYVGGDIVAGMLATGLTRDKRLRLFIDVGTNSEIALGSSERVLTTAAPAGPAFEAAQIRCGMRAAEGAIEGVKIADDEMGLEVIGDTDPIGMCGSGLVDAVAQLVGVGLIDHSGKFIPDEAAAELWPGSRPRVSSRSVRSGCSCWPGGATIPANAVYLSQRDVRELQFAKASIATGWNILVRDLGRQGRRHPQVLLAGSFGSYLSPSSAIRIGLVPKMALPRIISAGNVAGEGAKMAALSINERAAARAIPDEVEYVELSGREPTSTTCSSTSWRSRDERRGRHRMRCLGRARGADRRRRGWESTSTRCRRRCTTGRRRSPRRSPISPTGCPVDYRQVAVAYADCGTYGALDRVLAERGIRRLGGDHCYDVFGKQQVAEAAAAEPGTYFLTDFLAAASSAPCGQGSGLDRHPELRDDYFGNYTRVVWLAQRRSPELERAAGEAAARMGLPLEVRDVGDSGLERELEQIIGGAYAKAG